MVNRTTNRKLVDAAANKWFSDKVTSLYDAVVADLKYQGVELPEQFRAQIIMECVNHALCWIAWIN